MPRCNHFKTYTHPHAQETIRHHQYQSIQFPHAWTKHCQQCKHISTKGKGENHKTLERRGRGRVRTLVLRNIPILPTL